MVSGVRRLFAWAALVAFGATFGFGPVMPGHSGGDDDPACNIGLTSVHSSVQFETVKAPTSAAHCPFCHWQRVVGSASLASAIGPAVQFQPVDRVPLSISDTVPSVYLAANPPRGPPSENI